MAMHMNKTPHLFLCVFAFLKLRGRSLLRGQRPTLGAPQVRPRSPQA